MEDTLKIKVKAPADKGKANKAVIKILEIRLGLAKNDVEIISGLTSSTKIINISCDNEKVISKKLEDIHKN